VLILVTCQLLSLLFGDRFRAYLAWCEASALWLRLLAWFLNRAADWHDGVARLLRLEAQLLRNGFMFRRRLVQAFRVLVFAHKYKNITSGVKPPNVES